MSDRDGEIDVTLMFIAEAGREIAVKREVRVFKKARICLLYTSYQKDHPNVSVELVLYSSPEIDKALTTALAGRDDIDLFVTNGGQYLAAKVGTGMAENLDSYIEASGLDVSIYGSDYESTLYDDGSAYGLPYRNSCLLYTPRCV